MKCRTNNSLSKNGLPLVRDAGQEIWGFTQENKWNRSRTFFGAACILFSGLLIFGSIGPAIAQSNASVVSGQVFDGGGMPLEGAALSLVRHAGKDPSGGDIAEIQGQAITDRSGRFSITGLPADTYVLMAMYPGYRPLVRTGVIVNEQSPAEVELRFNLSR